MDTTQLIHGFNTNVIGPLKYSKMVLDQGFWFHISKEKTLLTKKERQANNCLLKLSILLRQDSRMDASTVLVTSSLLLISNCLPQLFSSLKTLTGKSKLSTMLSKLSMTSTKTSNVSLRLSRQRMDLMLTFKSYTRKNGTAERNEDRFSLIIA